MKFLIAGFGSIGRRHFRNLQALGEHDIVLLRSYKSTVADDEIKDVPVETSVEAALAYKPDAVIIANPTALHLSVALPAARAGCDIFMEKPISHSLAGIDELAQELRLQHKQMLMGFQFRFHPGLQKAKQLIEAGAIGRILTARSHWGEYLPDWHPWEDYRTGYAARKELGGGVVRTLSHPIDYMRWLLGEIEGVAATRGNLSDLELSEVEDFGEMQFAHQSGAFSTVHVNYFQQPPRHDLEIIGTQGTIRWDNADGMCRWWIAAQPGWREYALPQGFERNDLFLTEMRHFIEVVEKGTPVLCGLEDGKRVQEIIDQVFISD